jgi:hypothetical protein
MRSDAWLCTRAVVSNAWREIRARFDNSVECCGLLRGFGRTAGRTADPSTSLRFGRDDKGEVGAFREGWLVDDWNSRSLHFASLRSG